MSTITKPMALDESFNTTETNPRNIADVLAEMGEAIAQGMGRQANEVSYDNTTSGLQADDVQEAVDELAAEKVDKVTGKGLSTNDYTTEEKTKLAGIEAGAEVNVQSDWAQTDSSADDFIKNKQLVTEPIEELQNDVQSTQTATGNPLTLTNVAPINAESLVVELEPKQDLHGQAYPWVGGAGKNLFGGVYYDLFPLHFNTNTTITVSADTKGGSGSIQVYYYDENRQLIDYWGLAQSGDRDYKTFEYPSTAYYIAFRQTESTNYQVEVGSVMTAYAPYSNICPITGYTEVGVEDVGVNQWDEEWENGGIDYNTGNNTQEADRIRSKNFISVLPNNEYFIKSSGHTTALRFYDVNKNYISYGAAYNTDRTFTPPSNCRYLKFIILETTYNNDISINYPSTDHDYHAYQHSSATIQFGQTVYGGSVDFLTGVLTVDKGFVDLGSLSWEYRGSTATGLFRTTGIQDYKYESITPSVASCYKYQGVNVAGISDFANAYDGRFTFLVNATTGSKGFYVKNLAYTDATAFKTAMSGQTVCYELAEPFTIQLTPQELQLLKQYNHITTNGTTINLGYQPDNVIGEVKGEIENATPISGTVTATLLHEEDQGEDWIVGFTGEINGHFDPDHFDYYLTARYTHAYNDNTQILNMNNCTDGDYVQIWQTGTLDFSVDGGVTVTISVTATKLTFTVNCIGDSIFGIYSSSETTGQVKYLITPARKG